MTAIPELKTRRPTGKPPWPMILLAGAEKCGKSYSAAAFSASDLIDRTFFVELGEGYADHYGEIPGARYEIVEHDGTYVGIGRALRAATMQPRPNGKPHAIILDTATELWDLLTEEAQATANRRKGKGDDGEAQITMDLWNVAKKRWRHIVDLLRQYDGPVIITARLEQVTVMAPNGQPTTAKEWKVRAEKNLPFECDAVVKMPEQGKAILTGVRSLLLRTGSGLEVADFSIEKLLTSMGIRPGETQARSYTAPKAEQGAAEPQVQRSRPTQPPDDDPFAAARPAPVAHEDAPVGDEKLFAALASRIGTADGPTLEELGRKAAAARRVLSPEQFARLESLAGSRAADLRREAQDAATEQPPAAPAGAALEEPAPTPERPKGDMTDAQSRMLHAMLKGWTREEKLAAFEAILGRPVATSDELSKVDASRVIDGLKKSAEQIRERVRQGAQLPDDSAEQLYADLLAGIDGAANGQQLADVHSRASSALNSGALSAELFAQFDLLYQAVQERMADEAAEAAVQDVLGVPGGWASQGVRRLAGAGAGVHP